MQYLTGAGQSILYSIQCIQYITEKQYFWDIYLSIIIAQIHIIDKKVTDEGRTARVFWHDQFFASNILCLGLSHNLTANKNRNCPIIPYLNKCTDIQFSISITPVYILHNLNWKKTCSVALFILQVKPYINGYGNKCTLAMKECSLPHNWSLFLQCNFKFQEVF